MESLGTLTYRELQAFAKRLGVKANGSKADLINRLSDSHPGDDDKPVEHNTRDGRADKLPGGSDTFRDDANTPVEEITQHGSAHTPSEESDTRRGEADTPVTLDIPHDGCVQPLGDSNSNTHRDKSAHTPPKESDKRRGEADPPVAPDNPQDGCIHPLRDSDYNTHPDKSAPTPPEESDTCRVDSDRPIAPDKPQDGCVQPLGGSDSNTHPDKSNTREVAATDSSDEPNPQAGQEPTERRKSERLSAAKKEPRNVGGRPRKTKVKQPVAGRFERAHQNIFAGQASIESYGKTPKKSAFAKENIPLSKANISSSKVKPFSPAPARPFAFGSSVNSSVKRSMTVASKPCTLVVQRSTKKPTQVKEFRLSSNQTGKREGFTFKPYTGPVRPITPANKTSFNVRHQSKKGPSFIGPTGIKATLASGRAQIARKNARVESRKAQREKKTTEARLGRA